MASEPDPSGIGSVIHLVGTACDAYGDEVSFYVSGTEVHVGDIVLDEDTRDDFMRVLMEACRRADGEPPAMEAGHG